MKEYYVLYKVNGRFICYNSERMSYAEACKVRNSIKKTYKTEVLIVKELEE